MGWPKGKPRGPRKQRVEKGPGDGTFYNDDGPIEGNELEGSRVCSRPDGTLTMEAPVPSPQGDLLSAVNAGLAELPWNYRRAADWKLDPPTMPWQIVRCRECNLDMWTRNPEKRDVCEDDLWQLMQQIAEVEKVRVLRATDRMINVFRSHDPFLELTGSLPTVKK